MRPALPFALPSLLLAALAAGSSSCRADPEKTELAAYELAVEDLMARDDRVTAELADLREDMGTGLGRGDEYVTFSREQALPFYRLLRETASGLRPQASRLAKVHRHLLDYAEARAAHLEQFEGLLRLSKASDEERLLSAQRDLIEAERALLEKTGGRIGENAVAEALGATLVFQQRTYTPYGRGQKTMKQVEEAIRNELLTAYLRAADATKADLADEGAKGAGARWVRAADAFYRALLESLPRQEALRAAGLSVEERWAVSEEARKEFLEGFKAYRESLR